MADDARTATSHLTAADYVSAAAFERECRTVLANGWIPVCRSDEIAGNGAQKAVMAATTPILLARGEGGALNALSNVCRHRASILVASETRGPVIRCPYHLWTYGLDGRLQAAPFMDGVDVGGCDLPHYAAEEWGGWVFVNLDGRASPLAGTLAPLQAALAPDRLADWRIGCRLAFDHAWNWKVMIENFAESYHHIAVHPQTLQSLWPGGRSDASASTEQWIELRHARHAQAGTFTVFVVFPLLLLALSDPARSAFWYRMVPTGPERIELEIVGLFPPEIAADAETMERTRAQLLAIHMEDIPLCEAVQAGLHSPDAVLGPLSRLEAGIERFRTWVRR